MALADEFKAISGSKPAELLRRALDGRLQVLYQRLSLELDVQQIYRLQGKIAEVNELSKLLAP